MAVSWKLEIGGINLVSGRGNITATRTDDAVTTPPRVYQYMNVPLATEADRNMLLDSIKAEDIKAAQATTDTRTFINNFDQTGKSTLDAWEAVR